VTAPEHGAVARAAREVLATYRDAEDLIAVGAYQDGADPRIDRARRLKPQLEAFLTQPRGEVTDLATGLQQLTTLMGASAAPATLGEGAVSSGSVGVQGAAA
jgi:flagellum-specific ATP synthase